MLRRSDCPTRRVPAALTAGYIKTLRIRLLESLTEYLTPVPNMGANKMAGFPSLTFFTTLDLSLPSREH